MGIIVNSLSIISGTLLGNIFKNKIKLTNYTVLGISIMIISLVSFLENIFAINGMMLKSNELLVVVFSLIIGSFLGDWIDIEGRISYISDNAEKGFSNTIDAALFFGVGGLQVCGPVLMATSGDSSMLILKSLIDFPFAIMFGISYGKSVVLSALPVAITQFLIVALTMASSAFFDTTVVRQLCAMGYIILFFSGFNLICEKKNKINNVNMIIGIIIIILYNIVIKLWG